MDTTKLAEKLVRLHNTAQRLKSRAEIETEFRNLQIVINGIVWLYGRQRLPADPLAGKHVVNERGIFDYGHAPHQHVDNSF